MCNLNPCLQISITRFHKAHEQDLKGKIKLVPMLTIHKRLGLETAFPLVSKKAFKTGLFSNLSFTDFPFSKSTI